MGEYPLYIPEDIWKLIRIMAIVNNIECPEYFELTNEDTYIVLKTLSYVDRSETLHDIANKELDKMARWWQDQLFYDELEQILGEDDE